ncbi:MAG: hypothetical protein R3F24_09280 [Gammaproteobacteria bacterium]
MWQRLRLAVDAPNSRLAGYLARQLPASQQEDGARLVKAVADPEATLKAASGWSDRSLNREAVTVALKRRARRDIDSAMSHWQALQPRFAFEPAERAAILHDLALYAAVDYRPAAETWFERVPPDARSEQLVDWQLRAALAVQDWSSVLRITDDLPAPLAAEPHSRYWRARALASLKRESDAETTYASLANEANYYGFLAADKLGLPYTICSKDIAVDQVQEAALRQQTDVARALELHAIGWRIEAVRAWEFARAAVSEADRLPLIQLCQRQRLVRPGGARVKQGRRPAPLRTALPDCRAQDCRAGIGSQRSRSRLDAGADPGRKRLAN